MNVGGNLGTAASKLQHGEAHSEYAWAASRCPHIPAGSHPNGRRGRARRGHQASQGTLAPSNLQAGCGRLNQTGKTASQTTRKEIGLCRGAEPAKDSIRCHLGSEFVVCKECFALAILQHDISATLKLASRLTTRHPPCYERGSRRGAPLRWHERGADREGKGEGHEGRRGRGTRCGCALISWTTSARTGSHSARSSFVIFSNGFAGAPGIASR